MRTSIIAIMLGRLRMSVAEALQAYRSMAELAFSPKGFYNPFSISSRYSAEHLERAVKDIVKRRTGDDETLFRDPDGCRT